MRMQDVLKWRMLPMFMKYVVQWYVYISICVMLCGCSNEPAKSHDSSQMKQGSPEIRLSLQSLDPAANEVILQIMVTNVGARPLIIPHLREDRITHYMRWGGWEISIQDQDGRFFDHDDKRSPQIMKDELVELAPGEHFIVTINIADTQWVRLFEGDSVPHPELARANGEYTAIVDLQLDNSRLARDIIHTVWTGEVESNRLRFVIRHPDIPYLPKKLEYPERREDGEMCHCRADCDPAVPRNPCLQLPADKQSQTASAFGPGLLAAKKKARELARKKLGGFSTPQPCFCTAPNGEQGVVYH